MNPSLALCGFVLAAMITVATPADAQQDVPVREVRVTIYLADLSEITGADQSFQADVFLAATWQDPQLVGAYDTAVDLPSSQVWFPDMVIVNQRGASPTLPNRVRVQPDGSVRYIQRFNGRFSASMDLKEFPRDRQQFQIWVVAPARAGERVELVPDTSAARLQNDGLSITDWQIASPVLESAPFTAGPLGVPLSGVALRMEAEREVRYYLVQVMIPLLAIVLMAWSVFWIDPSVVPTRVGVVVTTMLTLIAYRFMLANHVPRLPYLTRLDWFMLGATVLLTLALFTMAGASYLRTHGKDNAVRRIDRTGRVAYPLVFTAYSLLVWFV